MGSRQNRPVHHRESFLRKQKARQERFLYWFKALGLEREACRRAGVSHDAIREWREKYAAFEKLYLAADANIAKLAENEAIRRGVYGVRRGVYYEGKLVAKEKEYSDLLLTKVLAARDRRYRNVGDGQPVQPFQPASIVINVVPDKKPGSDKPTP